MPAPLGTAPAAAAAAASAAPAPGLLAAKGGARPAQRVAPRPLGVEEIQRLLDAAAEAELTPLPPPASAADRAGADQAGAAVPPRTRTAAFTWRVAPDLHRRLRLACQLDARSAQALVTEAVERLLAGVPGLDDLARPDGPQS